MPNIWACPYERGREVKFAFGYSWIDLSGIGFTYANGSKPEEEDSLLHMDVRRQGKTSKDVDAADVDFDSIDGLDCAFINASSLAPRFGHNSWNELQIMLSYEGNQPLGLYTETVAETPLPAWVPDPRVYVGAVEGRPVSGDDLVNEVLLSKNRRSWVNVLSKEQVTETHGRLHAIEIHGSWRPHYKLRPKDDDARAGVSAEEDYMSNTLYFVNLDFMISGQTVHEVEMKSVACQLIAVLGRVGGFVTVIGLIFNTIFVKAHPSSHVTKIYEERVPFWESVKDAGDEDSEASSEQLSSEAA